MRHWPDAFLPKFFLGLFLEAASASRVPGWRRKARTKRGLLALPAFLILDANLHLRSAERSPVTEPREPAEQAQTGKRFDTKGRDQTDLEQLSE